MQRRRLWHCARLTLLAVVFVGGAAATVSAQESNSANYQVTETHFGAGSTLEGCSDQYCARASIGDMTAGTGQSGDTKATFGSSEGADPLLEVIIDEGESNLGVLSPERTATKTTTVKVRNYMSAGYVMQIIGEAPRYGPHTLATPTTPTTSQPGTEQFAINAVANTTPEVGADPVQVPSGEFSYGEAAGGYNAPNLFKYVSGDVVGQSVRESGQTDYTISMIVNVSNKTPAGHYAGDFSVVVIPVY